MRAAPLSARALPRRRLGAGRLPAGCGCRDAPAGAVRGAAGAPPGAAGLFGQFLSPSRVHDVANPRYAASRPSWVSDAGGLLGEGDRVKLEALCEDVQARWHAEVAVVLLRSLPPDVQPSGFAAALLNYWGVGDKTLHTGLLVLLLQEQRRLEMRVGFGAGRVLGPERLRGIQEEHMVPALRSGAAGEALCAGLRAVVAALEEGAPPRWRRGGGGEAAAEEPNRHGFGGGQTPVDEFVRGAGGDPPGGPGAAA